ncbi:tektin-4 [Esox lucius]|uniref:Tektin n=1 Tax=Esox lucius TaxID=8010 RepID=A0A3P8YLP1_ESOLU|nr:tektin-4 [Esox lucius]XP_019905340.2 tektin-4 [Esox lucius]XP_019905341.2 tektin-4 [Esox lucius]
MSSGVLVSRPHFDSRAVVQAAGPTKHTDADAAVTDGLYPSSGLATAGYRSAKYTTEDWYGNNLSTLNQAVADRSNAERIRIESKTLCTETEAGTLRSQAEGTRRLGERLQDMHLWKSELQRHIERLIAETDLLLGQKRRLEKALDATEIPFAIATDNLTCRERRPGPDLVKDLVEEELLKEVELIRSVQALLKRTLSQAVNQIKCNREAKQTLELDWSDKYQAYSLDDQCGRYGNTSTDTQLHPTSANVQDHVCNRDVWVRVTQDNLSVAQREERASAELRLLMDRVLQETAEDLRAQCSHVDRAFSQRCVQLTEAKTQLELHLAQILEQIGAQERNVVSLRQALHDKEAPLRVAQSRLRQRSQRPHMELCRDDPQLSLVDEVDQISRSISSLQRQLSAARSSLADLERSRLVLEKGVGSKTHSLLIDREKCMAQRTRYPTVIALSGY